MASVPESLDEPVLVGVYDMESGGLLEDVTRIRSLRAYLDSIPIRPHLMPPPEPSRSRQGLLILRSRAWAPGPHGGVFILASLVPSRR